jgi:O-glycosyl hydrolase
MMRWCAALLLLVAVTAPASEDFRFDAFAGKVAIWGRGSELPRVYFHEWLPAIFERTLVLRRFDPGDGTLEWIFTGDRGGFTVLLDNASVRLSQRFYDSFGFNPLEKPSRHPERVRQESSAALAGVPQSVRVSLNHRMSVAVIVDGKEVLRQICLLDVRRHQLAFSGKPGNIEGALERPESADTLVRVDPSRRHQTMLGFGGITTPMAWRELSEEGKRHWWQLLREYNLLLHREYPMGARLRSDMSNLDDPRDATPHYYGDNFPNGEVSDFDYIRQVRRIGGKVLFEFWDLPPWAAEPESYAQAMVRYCQISKERAGAPPDIVGIQNERTQPAPVWHEMATRLRRELDRAGFRSVKIHMQDASTLGAGIRSANAFRPVWETLDFTASHMYDYQQFFTNPDAFDALLTEWSRAAQGKPFLSTEISVNNSSWQAAGYRLALVMGELYHKNLTIANASALLYCWLLLNVEQPSYGATRSLFVPDTAHGFVPVASSHQLRVFGAYSRKIREGMVRVEAASSDPDLLVTAFAAENGERTLVLLNRSPRPQRVTVEWPGKPFRIAEVADPYRENAGQPPPTGKILVEPGAVVTLATQ